MLSVEAKATYDDSIVEYEYRTHTPFTSTTFNPNDEIRIAIQKQDGFTYPCESYLFVSGMITKADGATNDETIKLCNNAMAFLFREIRYELGGVVVDRSKNVGITSTIRNYVSLTKDDEWRLWNASWFGCNVAGACKRFSFCVPLNMLMGFFEDYNRIIINQKQELILLMAHSFKNALIKDDAAADFTDYKLNIEKVCWRVPYVKCSDEMRFSLLKILDQDRIIQMPFRSWELHEYPELPNTSRQSWTIKTSSQLEKPRYIILAFHTNRANSLTKDPSMFDKCYLSDVKLFLNSQYYPYDSLCGDYSLIYEMYARFQSSYYGVKNPHPIMKRSTFDSNPVFVIDCSKQPEGVRSGPVDVRLEFESVQPFPRGTTAYCLIIHDAMVEYAPLSGTVSRVQ